MAYRDKGVPKPLTPKQEAFAQAYLLTGNATAAYRQAYDTQQMQDPSIYVAAHALVHNPKITLRLDKLKADASRLADVTIADVVAGLLDIARNGRVESAKARAWELIGKHLGMFTDRIQVEGLLHHTGAVGQLSDSDLRRLLDALPAPTVIDAPALPLGIVAPALPPGTDTADSAPGDGAPVSEPT